MMQEYQHRLSGFGMQQCIKPLQLRVIKITAFTTLDQAVEHDQAQSTHVMMVKHAARCPQIIVIGKYRP